MAYTVAQMTKNTSTTYMTVVTGISASTINSPNPYKPENPFQDFALAGNFQKDVVYYLRIKLHKVPQYFYSARVSSSLEKRYNYTEADILRVSLILKNDGEDDLELNPPEQIGSLVCYNSLYNESLSYTSYSFVFVPTKNFNRLGFRLDRGAYDAIVLPRSWLLDTLIDQTVKVSALGIKSVTTKGLRMFWNNDSYSDFCILNNLIDNNVSWLKFGYQSRPGSLIVVNKEPIRVGRSGIYEINNGTEINSFMIAAPKGSDSDKIDAFLLDYAFNS